MNRDLKKEFFEYLRDREAKKQAAELKAAQEAQNPPKLEIDPASFQVHATPGKTMPFTSASFASPSAFSPSRYRPSAGGIIDGSCSVMVDAVNALQHAASAQLLKVALLHQISQSKLFLEERLLGLITSLSLPGPQAAYALTLAQSLAARIGQKWPVSLTLVMVGSFAMNTPSRHSPVVDMLMLPAEGSAADGFLTGVPKAAELLSHLSDTKGINVKIEHLESEKDSKISIPGSSVCLEEDARVEGSVDGEKGKFQLISQVEHQDCIEMVFTEAAYPEIRARLFLPSQVGTQFLGRKLSRFQAGSHHATWVRLISGEEIQIGVMHTLMLLRFMR